MRKRSMMNTLLWIGGAILVYKNWDTVKAFFNKLIKPSTGSNPPANSGDPT